MKNQTKNTSLDVFRASLRKSWGNDHRQEEFDSIRELEMGRTIKWLEEKNIVFYISTGKNSKFLDGTDKQWNRSIIAFNIVPVSSWRNYFQKLISLYYSGNYIYSDIFSDYDVTKDRTNILKKV